jgi:hypothetical protein
MATLNVFNSDAFKLQSMLQAINSVDYQPQRLGALGIFTPNPVRTETVAIESMDGVLSLIQTSKRGAPVPNRSNEKRKIRDFRSVRIAKQDRIMASELANIRAFGTESELQQVQTEIARRLSGPAGLMKDVELTLENMRLGAVQGIVLDADSSVIYNWFDEFGVVQPSEINFDLAAASPASGAVRKLCNQVVRAMMKTAKGVWTPATRVHALCGDAFWDDLTAHTEVRQTYLNTQQAAELRNGNAYETFNYGGITWENYRGTDDGTSVAINTDKAKFFPVNAPGAFLEVFSPGEQFEHIGQLGERIYPMIVPDRDRQMYADIEVYSYPLHICTRPLMLQRAKRTA